MAAVTLSEVELRHPLPLPRPVCGFIDAVNAGEIESLCRAFADDALVNDQLRDHWGKAEIREWAARDIIGQQLTIHATIAVERHGQMIVSAEVDGEFDKRDLSAPWLWPSISPSMPAGSSS